MDVHQHWEIASPRDVAKLAKILEQERIFDFLAGLRPEYDEVRSRLLDKNVVPDLHEVFSIIRDEESRQTVMLGSNNEPDQSALKVSCENTAGSKKNDQWRDFSNRNNHTRETC